jgi:hypothetical protein
MRIGGGKLVRIGRTKVWARGRSSILGRFREYFYQMILPELVNGGEFTRLGISVHGPPQESLMQG